MKKLTKRIISAMLCAVLALPVLAGCDSADKTETTGAPDGTPAATTDGGSAATSAVTTAPPAATTAATTVAPEPTAPAPTDDGWVSAVYGGGPFVTQLNERSNTLKKLQSSGFNTAIVWSVHVHDDGSLWLNDVEVADDGKIVANSRITNGWKLLKGEGSSITRVELSVGAWGCKDFEAIGAMMDRDGTGPDTELYKNFKALIDAYDADAINFDDETCYDPTILTRFGEMCADMGVKVTLCPYTRMDVWVQVKENLGDKVDRIYVQCYEGGAGNQGNLSAWRTAFGMDVIPGLYNRTSSASAVDSYIGNKTNRRFITGGFMWLWDEMEGAGSPNSVSDYAEAINKNNRFS